MLFKPSTNQQAYLKAGIMGFAGSGKTFTAAEIAIGLHLLLQEHKYPGFDKPIFFLDTETGSDWVAPKFADNGIELSTAKTRAFKDLIPAIKETESNGSILLLDSISHFWRELTESYAKRKNRNYGLQFQDWAWLKQEWGKFTDTFVNSSVHIIMCGRAGYEYDFFENESGKKELEKTGIKMKAETETGYEPSILVLMEKHLDMETKKAYRTANVLKDRADLIDGKIFRNPTFDDFLPHINFLNLGGKQLGVDTSRNSESMISTNGKSEWQIEKQEVEVTLDEIQSLLTKHYPATTKDDKQAKLKLLEAHLDSRSWKRIETYRLSRLQDGYEKLHIELEGSSPYPPQKDDEKLSEQADRDQEKL